MNVSLTPKLEALIDKKVKSGLYTSASEVVREALRLLEERDQLLSLRRDELRKEIQKGLDSGPATVLDIKAIKRAGREKLARQKK